MKSKLTFRAAQITWTLRSVTLMGIINCLVKSTRGNDRFIDRYVIFTPLIPLFLFTFVPYFHILSILWPFGIWRVFEIVIFLLNTLLFDDYRLALQFKKLKPLAGVRRPLILLVFNYFEIIFWFTYAYRLIIPQLQSGSYKSWIDALNLSFVTFSAFGSHTIDFESCLLTSLKLLESLLGLFVALAAVSSFVALIPQRESDDAVERRIKRRINSA